MLGWGGGWVIDLARSLFSTPDTHTITNLVLPVTLTRIFLLNVCALLTVSSTKHWYTPLCEELRLLPIKVPLLISLLLPCFSSLSGIVLLLCFHLHVKFFPMASHGRTRAFSFLNLTCSGLIKSSLKNFMISGGRSFRFC